MSETNTHIRSKNQSTTEGSERFSTPIDAWKHPQPFVYIDPKIVKRIELIETRLEKIEEYLKKLVEGK